MVGMSLRVRFDGAQMIWLLTILLFSFNVRAGADPDEHRPVQEGHVRYDGEGVQVGKVYEAFLIRFADREEVYLSPSRYRVAYTPNALQCRNADDFPVAGEVLGNGGSSPSKYWRFERRP